jgi:hypothetical protein
MNVVLSLGKQRAQGRPGARCTRGLACKGSEKNAHEHTGSAEAFRPSLRNGFTAYFVLSPAIGFLATVTSKKLASWKLDASTEASGPHDLMSSDFLPLGKTQETPAN